MMADPRSLLLPDPRQVQADQFPQAGSPPEKLAYLLNYAVLAPSLLNAQPWRFRIEGERLLLLLDHRRLLPVTDPKGREMTISCGAALFNLRVAARGLHHQAHVSLLPAAEDADVLAEIAVSPASEPTADEREAFEAISRRRTTRTGFSSRPLPRGLVAHLVAAAREEGGTLLFLDGLEARGEIGELTAEAERRQLSDPAYREELARWVQNRRSEGQVSPGEAEWRTGGTPFGPAGHTPDLRPQSDLFTPMAAQVARSFGSPHQTSGGDRGRTKSGSALALLTTPRDTRADWLAAGQALESLLLKAAAAGVSASYLSPPLEVAAVRQHFAESLAAEGRPQVLLQLGYAEPIPPAARRSAAEVLE